MSSEHSIRDRAIRDHQAWLGFLQPDGLVVSPTALVESQVILDTRVIETQARFEPLVSTIENQEADRPVKLITNFADFCLKFLQWPEELLLGTSAGSIPESLIVPLAELGETLEPTYALSDPKPKEPKAGEPVQPWILLIKELPTGTDLDAVTTGEQGSWSASASRRFERLLRETRVPIGLLANGTHIRLVYAPRGENSGSLTFPVAAMTEVAGRPILAAFHELLSCVRLLAAPTAARLPALLVRSREYQSTVSTELAQQVIDAAFDLLRGFQAADERTKGALLKDVLATSPNLVYEGLLTVLMRCVFLLYAEDRGLMPGGSLYQQNYAVHGLFERLRADHERYPDTMDSRYGAWSQLLALFRAIYSGCRHPSMTLPARAGYLFDPHRFPFVEGRTASPTGLAAAAAPGRVPLVPDGTIFRILEKLLMLDGERLSYRTLDVEQIGSVYEVMMGFGIGIAAGQSIAIKAKKTHGAPVPINLEELLKQPAGDRGKWLKSATDQDLSDKPGVALKAAKSVDDLLAALDQGKKIARSATPSPVPKGAMLLVPSDERRRSGSNYTPRSLTEPIVRKTLEPILKRLGDDATPEQILDLKVCDPAMGSGAFLVEVCRQLADRLIVAWHRHKQLPAIPADEDELLYAKRLIAQRCLYGVDKNPMAADLAKLSMWLTTLAKDHAFTFLDHSFRAGDSLVGLSKAQIASFTWEPGGGLQKQIWSQLIEPRIDAALAARREILVAGDFMNPETKRQKLAVADEQLGLVRFIGDLAIAAFFAGEKDKQRKDKRADYLQQLTTYLGDRSKLGGGGAAGDITKRPQRPVDALRAGEKGVTPFHWEIEFPEVFGRQRTGFDAIVGNPPFLGGAKISTVSGMRYFDYVTERFPPAGHQCDLVGYFFRRAFELSREGGSFGLIATNTIAQGDTRNGGLGPILAAGGTIYAAERRYKWPGLAAVVVSVVHVLKGRITNKALLDGKLVDRISAYLFDGPIDHSPAALQGNPYYSKGTQTYGQGFLFDDTDDKASPLSLMNSILKRHPDWQSRILPFIGGEEVNTQPEVTPYRYAIYLTDLDDEADLNRYPEIRDIVRERVKPERDILGDNPNNIPLKRRWWAYQAHRPELYARLAERKRVLVHAEVGPHLGFSFVPTGWMYNKSLVIMDLDGMAAFSCLQSHVHEAWTRFLASSLEDRLRYTGSDCFATFPFPEGFETDPPLETAGRAYYELRTAMMVQNDEGLTKTYNRFHDPEENSPDILKLRDLHTAMDRAVLDAYGWTDIPTVCEFLLDYEEDDDDDASSQPSTAAAATGTGKGRKKRKPYRYRWPDAVRDEVLAKLLALNAERAQAERLSGAAAGVKAAASTKKPRGSGKTKTSAGSAGPTLFAGGDE